MATLRNRGSKWQAQVRVQGAPPVSRSFAVRKDAEVWAKEIELSIFRNGSPASDQSLKKTTLDQLLERYERTVTPTKKGRGPESYMLRTLRRHAIARLALDKLTSASVAAYRDDRVKSVSPSTVRRELAVLQHCLHVAVVDWGFPLKGNPVALIKKPKPGLSRERRISAHELAALKDGLAQCRNPMLSNIVAFAIATGMRRGEILAFRWRDIDPRIPAVHLRDTKNGHPRTVPLSPAALAALPIRSVAHEEGDRVFPMSANALRLAWERLRKRAGIEDLHFHDLRHEAISRFFELGLNIPEVRLISGHRDARMLFRYTHLKPVAVAEKLSKLMDDDQTSAER